jgi:two-component system, NtrC family, sensor histidine kinase PilS
MPSPPPALQTQRPQPPSDLAWRVVGLVNLYRVLVASGLLVLAQIPEARGVFSVRHVAEFTPICGAWLLAGLGMVFVRRRFWRNAQLLSLAHVVVDSVAVGAILWATDGVASGLGILLLLPVGAMAVLASNLHAVFLAAIATIALLLQQTFSQLAGEAQVSDYLSAGVLGTVIFLVALLVRPLANRITESEALVRRQEIDLANLAQLSQYIVQHLRESILVVDADDRIRLINESAAQMLGDRLAWPGALLGEATPRLLFLLSTWRGHGDAGDGTPGTFPAADGARVIQPHFATLGGGSRAAVLIFLEDTGLLAEKVQQSKLAGLGRLSASIAHEIRNPVGAMSHAAQLLQESPHLAPDDMRLTEIIRTNGQRVSRIIENVLQFSRRGTSKLERVTLKPFLEQFLADFCATLELAPARLHLAGDDLTSDSLEVRADPLQLNQILWNLCQNAITHAAGVGTQPGVAELTFGRLPSNGRPYVEVADRGPGIQLEDAERVFEPFFTRSAKGTGLGLFLARELAQANGATLLHEPRAGGGSVFRIVFTDPGRWELVS